MHPSTLNAGNPNLRKKKKGMQGGLGSSQGFRENWDHPDCTPKPFRAPQSSPAPSQPGMGSTSRGCSSRRIWEHKDTENRDGAGNSAALGGISKPFQPLALHSPSHPGESQRILVDPGTEHLLPLQQIRLGSEGLGGPILWIFWILWILSPASLWNLGGCSGGGAGAWPGRLSREFRARQLPPAPCYPNPCCSGKEGLIFLEKLGARNVPPAPCYPNPCCSGKEGSIFLGNPGPRNTLSPLSSLLSRSLPLWEGRIDFPGHAGARRAGPGSREQSQLHGAPSSTGSSSQTSGICYPGAFPRLWDPQERRDPSREPPAPKTEGF